MYMMTGCMQTSLRTMTWMSQWMHSQAPRFLETSLRCAAQSDQYLQWQYICQALPCQSCSCIPRVVLLRDKTGLQYLGRPLRQHSGCLATARQAAPHTPALLWRLYGPRGSLEPLRPAQQSRSQQLGCLLQVLVSESIDADVNPMVLLDAAQKVELPTLMAAAGDKADSSVSSLYNADFSGAVVEAFQV